MLAFICWDSFLLLFKVLCCWCTSQLWHCSAQNNGAAKLCNSTNHCWLHHAAHHNHRLQRISTASRAHVNCTARPPRACDKQDTKCVVSASAWPLHVRRPYTHTSVRPAGARTTAQHPLTICTCTCMAQQHPASTTASTAALMPPPALLGHLLHPHHQHHLLPPQPLLTSWSAHLP